MEPSSVALSECLSQDLHHTGSFGPYADCSTQQFAKYALSRSLLKKFRDDIDKETADARCFSKFLSANQRCGSWELRCNTSLDEVLVGCFLREIDNLLHPAGEPLVSSYFDLLRSGRGGPGASLGANGEDFYTKYFASKVTATSWELYDQYNAFCSWFPVWRDAEISRALTHGVCEIRSSSSLSFVRKTRDISRSICTEPSLNMFFQLGLAGILQDRLRSFFGIDLSDQQEWNKRLACQGSLDGSVATLDLESASDSVSMGLARYAFPKWFFDLLCMLRVDSCRYRNQVVDLNMVSTMGNGFTFPLQTAIFASVVRAVASSYSHHLVSRGDGVNWGVFGDDIICPTFMVRRVMRLLDLLGFVVNEEKSFFEGPFRESCGGDYFKGVDVRGVYLKTLATTQARYVAINRLNEWSARHGIYLTKTVGYLLQFVEGLAVPPHSADDSGVRTPLRLLRSSGSQLAHSKKQRYLYRCYEPVRTVLTISDDGFVHTPKIRGKRIRRRTQNPSGLWVAFVGGYVTSTEWSRTRVAEIYLRGKQEEAVRYRKRRKVSPHWGPSSEQLLTQGGWNFWKRWESAAEVNLEGYLGPGA